MEEVCYLKEGQKENACIFTVLQASSHKSGNAKRPFVITQNGSYLVALKWSGVLTDYPTIAADLSSHCAP